MPKILVTGAAGFIGSHTCERLVDREHLTIGIDNLRTGRRENLRSLAASPRFSFIEADVRDSVRLRGIIQEARPEVVIHLAALVSVEESTRDPGLNFSLNIEATHALSESVRGTTVSRIVFASSAAVYGNPKILPIAESAETSPISPYGGAKLASEAMLVAAGSTYGFSVWILRYFNVFGPRQDPSSSYSGVISLFARKLARGEGITIHGTGEQTRDFISVHDVCRANELAATVPGNCEITNICTGRPLSIGALAAQMAEISGKPLRPSFQPPRPVDIARSVGDTERAASRLQFRAQRDLRESLHEMLTCINGRSEGMKDQAETNA